MGGMKYAGPSGGFARRYGACCCLLLLLPLPGMYRSSLTYPLFSLCLAKCQLDGTLVRYRKPHCIVAKTLPVGKTLMAKFSS